MEPTPIPTSAASTTPVGSGYFSATTLVDTLDRGTIAMSKLKVGDQIRTVNGKFDTVYSFGHRDPSAKTHYLQITMHDGSQIEITAEHMVQANRRSCAGSNFVTASSIKVDDFLINRLKQSLALAPLLHVPTLVVS
jgi:hypothetical protein